MDTQATLIQQLEQELTEMTVALSQAWDQLVPLLQESPIQIKRSEDILPLLDSLIVATDATVAAIYFNESDDWFVLPSLIDISPALKKQVISGLEANQPIYLTEEEVTLTSPYQWVFVPLVAEQQTAGAIGLGIAANQREYTAVDLRILQRVADRVAGQIVVAHLAMSREREAKLSRELEIANHIQRSIQPDTFPKMSGLQLASFWQPARWVGGDAWGWVQVAPDRMTCFMLDVAGKGLPAALAAVSLHAAIRMALRIGMSPTEVISAVNSEFYDAYTATDLLATVVIASFCTTTGEMEQANAGHLPTLIRHGDAWRRLEATVPPIGMLPELTPQTQYLALNTDDLILFYSDGFTEIETAAGFWGEQGIIQAVPDLKADSQTIIQGIVEAATAARGTVDLHDDQTLIAIRIQ